jgi:hypothetical protein
MESHPGLVRVCPGHPGHGLTRRVDRVLPGRCTGRSFDKPEPVQPPGRPGPGSTRRAGPGLITINGTLPRPTHERVDASQIIVLSFIMVVQQNRIQN